MRDVLGEVGAIKSLIKMCFMSLAQNIWDFYNAHPKKREQSNGAITRNLAAAVVIIT